MSKRLWLRSLVVPVIILSTLFVAFAGYYLYWVPNRQRHLDDRGFRYLKTLSDQIRLTLNTYDKMLDNAVGSGIIGDSEDVTRDNLRQFLGNVAPHLVVPEKSETDHIIGGDYDDPPKIAVRADEGTHFLYLAFSDGVNFSVKTDLDKLINGFVGPPDLSPFDVVLVAQSNGKVVFQKSLSGVEVAKIENFEDASGEVKGKTDKINVSLLSQTSRLEEVKIAGARYRLYSQPLQIGFLPANPNKKSGEPNQKLKGAKGNPTERSTKGKPNEKSATEEPQATSGGEVSDGKSAEGIADLWVLCGLVRADRFRSESQLIPYVYILTILAAILLAALSYPFLKLYLLNPGERMRARDVTITAVFVCLVAAVVTFILADIYYWNISFGPSAEGDMEKLAKAINANFKREQAAALAGLDALNGVGDLSKALHQAEDHSKQKITVLYSGSNGTCNPGWGCKANILNDKNDDEKMLQSLRKYPYLFFASWSDSNGKQQIKWTTRQRPTPFLASLDDPSTPYYPDVKRALKKPADLLAVPVQGIGSQYSATTGQNITTFWKVELHPTDKDKKPYEGDEEITKRYSYSLVTQPISLYNAVLPGGFQFAVLTPDGTVVFHSDPTRNLRENFFAETDQNPDLRSRVIMRAAGPVVADYIGRPHRMYVQPMDAANQDGVWSIVIFRDLHLEEVMNLEMLSLVSILLFVYGGAIALVLVSARWIRSDHATRLWFWPDSRRVKRYLQIASVNIIAIILVVVLVRWLSPLVLLLCASLIPAAALLLNLVMPGRRSDLHEPADQLGDKALTRWQYAYFGACATLLVLVAVLPCLYFFNVAANFEHRLLIEHTQLQLAADLDNRALSVQKLYRDVHLSKEFQEKVLAGPERQQASELDGEKQPPPPFFSYHELLSTHVYSSSGSPDASPVPWKVPILGCRPVGPRADENAFLSCISYPYNERAANDRHLAEGGSDEWRWTLSPRGRTRILILKITKRELGEQDRVIASLWAPFQFPWDHWPWWLGSMVFLTVLYWLVRLGLSRIFLLNLIAPPLAKDSAFGLSPARLMADLPMNLLIIGPESCRPIARLIHRPDVQVHEAEELLDAVAAQAKPVGGAETSKSAVNPIDGIIRDGRPLVLRCFDRLPDDPESSAKINAVLLRILSELGNSVIIIFDMDPLSRPSIEASERWRILLQSFVRIDLNLKPGQRFGEDDADYQNRVSANSYFRWLISGLSKPEELVMLQLAQEHVVNPNSSEMVSDLMAQGLIEGRWGLLTVKDDDFAKFLKHAIPHHTVRSWEKQIGGTRPATLQWSLLILGVGVVAFLIYTQGDVFNTWVTYATGVAAAVPKVLQLLDSVRPKSGAKA